MNLLKNTEGQGTVEAAFAIPVLFLLLLLLIQPGILLYDYIVMRGTAVEACRLMATQQGANDNASTVDFIKNRLAAIPQHDCFHVHSDKCSWSIELNGDGGAGLSEVRIKTEVKPLPIFDETLSLLGLTNGNGNLEIGVNWISENQPSWVQDSVAGGPQNWVEAW